MFSAAFIFVLITIPKFFLCNFRMAGAPKKTTRPAASKKVAQRLPTVPETLLKKRKAATESRAQKAKDRLLARRASKVKRTVIFKKAEQYAKEYTKIDREQIRLQREAKRSNNFYVPEEPRVAFAVRIRGINGIHPKPRKTLQLAVTPN
jgi:hypothetical protein